MGCSEYTNTVIYHKEESNLFSLEEKIDMTTPSDWFRKDFFKGVWQIAIHFPIKI